MDKHDAQDWTHFLMQLQRFTPDDELERCGAIVFRQEQHGYSLFEMNNEHTDPAGHFGISWQQLTELDEYHPELIHSGWLHVHPGYDPYGWKPSMRDVERTRRYPELLHAIYHPYSRNLAFYDGLGAYEYLRVRPTMWPIRKKTGHGPKSTLAKRLTRQKYGLV